jgi:hypothetical protein
MFSLREALVTDAPLYNEELDDESIELGWLCDNRNDGAELPMLLLKDRPSLDPLVLYEKTSFLSNKFSRSAYFWINVSLSLK